MKHKNIHNKKANNCRVYWLLFGFLLAATPSIGAAVKGEDSEVSGNRAEERLYKGALTSRDYLEEVVVTATKRSKALRQIPASILALQGDDLEKKGIQGIADIVKLAPGVNVTADLGIQRVTIRGIAPETGTNLTTGTLFGNISFSDTYVPLTALDPNPFDIESVEVLKGPQGTLFGASALNGAIRYVPVAPVMNTWEAKYFWQKTNVKEGDTGETYGVALNVPFGGNGRSAIRIVAFDRNAPGYVDNVQLGIDDSNETEQDGLRAILSWQPAAPWDISLTYAEQETASEDYALADNEEGNLKSNNRPRLSPTSNEYDFTALSVNYDMGWALLTGESGKINKSSKNFLENTRAIGINNLALNALDFQSESETWSHELRLTSDDSRFTNWQWVTGLFSFEQNIKHRQSIVLGEESTPVALIDSLLNAVAPGLGDLSNDSGQVTLLRIRPDVDVDEVALFGEVSRFFGKNKNWEATLGGRYYKTSSKGESVRDGLLILAITQDSTETIVADVEEESFNPKASLLWNATDNILTYVSASKGFRIGGVQAGLTLPISETPAPDAFQSDSVWSYELGMRTQWFKGALLFDVTAFKVDWEDPQTIQPESNNLATYLDNVGGVESKGVDVTFQVLFPWVPGLSLRSSASFVDTVTTEDFQTGSGRMSKAGDPWPFAQDRQTVTTLSYFTNVYNWTIDAGVTHTYMGEAVNNLSFLRPIFDYEQWDVQFRLGSPAIPWLPEISLIAHNVKDERGIINYIQQGPESDVTYIRPRSLIVRISGAL